MGWDMASEMDHFTFQSCDNQLSWCSLLAFLSLLGLRADSCTEGRGEEGWKAFPCTGSSRACPRRWQRAELKECSCISAGEWSEGFWLRGSDWKAGLHRIADLFQLLPVFLSSLLPRPSLNNSPGLEVGHTQLPLAGVMGSGAPLCVRSASSQSCSCSGEAFTVSPLRTPLWLTALGSSVARWNGCCASRQG